MKASAGSTARAAAMLAVSVRKVQGQAPRIRHPAHEARGSTERLTELVPERLNRCTVGCASCAPSRRATHQTRFAESEVVYLDGEDAPHAPRGLRRPDPRRCSRRTTAPTRLRLQREPLPRLLPRLRLLLRAPDARVSELRGGHRLRTEDRRQARRARALARGVRRARAGRAISSIFSGVTDCYQPLEARTSSRAAASRCAPSTRTPAPSSRSRRSSSATSTCSSRSRGWRTARVAVSLPFLREDHARALEPFVTTPARRLRVDRATRHGGRARRRDGGARHPRLERRGATVDSRSSPLGRSFLLRIRAPAIAGSREGRIRVASSFGPAREGRPRDVTCERGARPRAFGATQRRKALRFDLRYTRTWTRTVRGSHREPVRHRVEAPRVRDAATSRGRRFGCHGADPKPLAARAAASAVSIEGRGVPSRRATDHQHDSQLFGPPPAKAGGRQRADGSSQSKSAFGGLAIGRARRCTWEPAEGGL